MAKEFEPSGQTIRNWVQQADRDDGLRHDGLTSQEWDKLRRLRRENRQLREECEILSKAAAWFAQSQNPRIQVRVLHGHPPGKTIPVTYPRETRKDHRVLTPSSGRTVLDRGSFKNEYNHMFEIRHYLTPEGKDLITEWLRDLRDIQAKVAIIRRLNRLEEGLFGDCKPLREGIFELRIDVGPGYRVYYAQAGKTVMLLLCGGAKRTQSADVDRACACWCDWQTRKD